MAYFLFFEPMQRTQFFVFGYVNFSICKCTRKASSNRYENRYVLKLLDFLQKEKGIQ